MRLLVCGNRGWQCRDTIRAWLQRLPPGTVVIHGAAKGADALAGEVARELGFDVEEYSADWKRHGNRAGPLRNEEMADKAIERGIAFGSLGMPGGKRTGTGDMVDRLNLRGVLVTVVPRPGVWP